MKQVAVIFVLVALAFGGGITYEKENSAWKTKESDYYRQTYLQKQGGTTLVPGANSYDLRSFDGGKNWYAVEQTKESGMKILGPADKIYPGLLEHLYAFETLVKYVELNGPATLSGSRAKTDKAILDAAGLTVQDKKKENKK